MQQCLCFRDLLNLYHFLFQGHTQLSYLIAVVMMVCHVLFNHVLVDLFETGTVQLIPDLWKPSDYNLTNDLNHHLPGVWGLSMAALGSRLTTLLLAFTICLVLKARDELAWGGISSRVFQNWGPMLKLGLSGELTREIVSHVTS